MYGLRVYFNPVTAEMEKGQKVFYSRKEGGPFYRWRYEDEPRQWRSSRLHPSDISLKALCLESWKAVPEALQARLKEHYVE